MSDARQIVELAERADDLMREYAKALYVWNAPDHEHTRLLLRGFVEDVIADAQEDWAASSHSDAGQ